MCEALRELEQQVAEENYSLGEKCGLEKGREEGIAIGEKETKISIAKSLILTGILSLEDIARVTVLSIEEVQRLKQTVLN